MAYTRIVGDVHGASEQLFGLICDMPEHVTSAIQVGDMGVGFGQSDYWLESLDLTMVAANARFIRGNHDNPALCKNMSSYIRDCTVEKHVMYMGGAWSIDQQWRTQDVDWWEDEQLSYAQLSSAIDKFEACKPRIMITHDCPTVAATHMFLNSGLLPGGTAAKLYANRTSSALQDMYDKHEPDLWIFGHWHHTVNMQLGNTRFMCLGELDYVDIDLENLEFRLDKHNLL